MDLHELAPQLKTGDIFLFHGVTPISEIINAMTHSCYSHIAMVFRDAGTVGSDGLHLWQSFEPEGGVVDDDLRSFLLKYSSTEPGATYVCRQIGVEVTPVMAQALDSFMQQAKGRPFPGYAQWIQNYLGGCLGIASKDGTFYCSEYVAQGYIEMGLLKSWPFSTVYTPGRFSIDAYDLQLQLGATLGAEIPVTVAA